MKWERRTLKTSSPLVTWLGGGPQNRGACLFTSTQLSSFKCATAPEAACHVAIKQNTCLTRRNPESVSQFTKPQGRTKSCRKKKKYAIVPENKYLQFQHQTRRARCQPRLTPFTDIFHAHRTAHICIALPTVSRPAGTDRLHACRRDSDRG